MWRLYAYAGFTVVLAAKADLIEHIGTVLFFGAAPEAGDYAFISGEFPRGILLSFCNLPQVRISVLGLPDGR